MNAKSLVLMAAFLFFGCADGFCKVDSDCRAKNYMGETMVGVCKHPDDSLVGGSCNYDGKVEKTSPSPDTDNGNHDVAANDSWDSTTNDITDDTWTPPPPPDEDPPPLDVLDVKDTSDGSPDDGNVSEDPETSEDMDVPDTNENADADSTNTDGDVEVEIDTEEVIEPPKCSDADCDDKNPCTKDSCDPATGCSNENMEGNCDDGDACTENDYCQTGVCKGSPAQCNDSNPCTDDSCESSSGCVYAPNNDVCEDDNPCTENDLCSDSTCNAGANICACLSNADCTKFEDGDSCNGTLACEGNECVVKGIVECAPSATACHYFACVPASGQCILFPETGTACDDGSACTVVDVCLDGLCVGKPIGCDDNNVCTDDACDPTSGCTNTNNTAPCNDENACSTNDTCLGGNCQAGTPLQCDDGKLCNGSETCNPETGCEPGSPIPSCCSADVDCEDGSACTTNVCDVATGKCASTPVTCDDGDACTTETCDPTEGCTYDDVECNDGNPCTSDTCINGKCEFVPNSNPCDDGDACTTADHCKNGACAVKDVECDDGNICTDDSCDPASGCAYAPNVASCDDGDGCTTGDACVATVCKSGPPLVCNDSNSCTDDACVNGKCTFLANDTNPCDDGDLCTVGDACLSGSCVPGSPTICTALDQCHSVGSCNPATGECSTPAKADGTVCTDNNPCTDGDACSSGNCQAGPPLNCDDKNVNGCTVDLCDPGSGGCIHPVWVVNPPQGKCGNSNIDGDGWQDVSGNDVDADNDGVCDNAADLAWFVKEPDAFIPGGYAGPQSCSGVDNCWWVKNADQKDSDKDGIGDACDPTPNN